jgi:hypothetical protein
MPSPVSAASEDALDDAFWDTLDVAVTAVPSLEDRAYVDARCVRHSKALLDGGVDGARGSVQVGELGCPGPPSLISRGRSFRWVVPFAWLALGRLPTRPIVCGVHSICVWLSSLPRRTCVWVVVARSRTVLCVTRRARSCGVGSRLWCPD